MKFSGISFPSGIVFFGEKYRVTLFNGKIKIKKSGIIKDVNIFLLIYLVFLFFIDVLHFYKKTIREKIGISLIAHAPSFINQPPEVLQVFFQLLSIILLCLFIFFLLKTRSWHGAEHKTIAAAEANNLINAKEYKKEHPRCGTNLFPLYIFFYSFISFTSISLGLSLFCMKNVSILNKLGTNIGMKLQKITTKEPSDEQLNLAMEGMKQLFKAEESSL